MLSRLLALTAAVALLTPSCRHEEKFPPLGTKIVSPVDVASSVDGKYFYVLNADMDRSYNQGSVLVLDKDGNRVTAIPTPRMGRSMTVAGTDMIVTIDYQDLDTGAEVLLFSLTDPAKPKLEKSFPIACSPYNAEARAGYKYFAVSCVEGALYVGTFATNRPESTLQRVRRYGSVPRHALYIDPRRNLLMGFVTDPTKGWTDAEFADAATYDEAANLVNGEVPNEIPDDYENSRRALTTTGERQIYQYFVLDLEAEAAQGFPYRLLPDPIYKKELRWLYFSLSNFDGTPDGDQGGLDPKYKYYRTNFWAARPDPDDTNSFYLSHRGLPPSSGVTGSPHANQIVKVTIVGDLRATDGPDGTAIVPETGKVMSFERVYGFKGAEVTKYSYPSDFRIQNVAGEKVVLVNHFRDLVNWVPSQTYFSLGAASLEEGNLWFTETGTKIADRQDARFSWYQVALTDEGRALSCSFYGDAVMLLDVTPGIGIKLIKRIQ